MLDSWRLIFIHLVLYAARLPLCSPQSDFNDILPMLGPRAQVDVVGVLDRSQGVGAHNFYYFVLPFFEALLTQYAAIHRDFARSAVVSFARDATISYDSISDSDNAVSKCELFGASGPWNRIKFDADPRIKSGTNLSGALQHTIDILERGRQNRPNVTQVKQT